MLILAGVSLNAIVGDNGIITNAQRANVLSNVADIEEFLQQYYVSNFEIDGEAESENKIEEIIKLKPNWFYHKYSMSVIDNEGHELWLIDKSNFIKDYKKEMIGGDAGNKTYNDYYELNDVYGVTSNLKVYYCGPSSSSLTLDERLYGVNSTDLDLSNPIRNIASTTDNWRKINTFFL